MNIRDRKVKSLLGSEIMQARFMAKVEASEAGGCHEWLGTRHSNGYGQMRINGVIEYAHRLAWMLVKGAIPFGLYVLHRCDNRRCVNAEHMFLGTQADNVADRMSKGRRNGVGAQFKPWRSVPEWRKAW
jgi:hypothetical protein